MDTTTAEPAFLQPHYLIFILVGLVLLLLAFGLVAIYYKRRLLHEQVRLKQLEITYQRRLLEANIGLQEAERKFVAENLRNEIISPLASLQNVLQELAADFASEHPLQGKTQRCQTLLNQTIAFVQAISTELLPPALNERGLMPALEQYLQKYSTMYGLQLVNKSNKRVALYAEKALYRTVRALFLYTYEQTKQGNIIIRLLQPKPGHWRLVYEVQAYDFTLPFKEGHPNRSMQKVEIMVHLLMAQFSYEELPEQQGARVLIDFTDQPTEPVPKAQAAKPMAINNASPLGTVQT